MTNKIKRDLLLMKEEKYKRFSSSLIPTVREESVLGVRVPILRNYAKTLDNYEEFLLSLPHEYFEENNLHAFLIEREKDFDKCIEKLDKFLPFVDNWATCDGVKPKILKKHPEKLLIHIKKWLDSSCVYAIRYAINLLMSYYLEENFKEEYLSLVASIKSDEYYINMMRAWYFATALAKRYEETLPYLEKNLIDKWTHEKTIRKAIESFRISKEQKEYLKTLRRV